jgi:hypothetical protein
LLSFDVISTYSVAAQFLKIFGKSKVKTGELDLGFLTLFIFPATRYIMLFPLPAVHGSQAQNQAAHRSQRLLQHHRSPQRRR